MPLKIREREGKPSRSLILFRFISPFLFIRLARFPKPLLRKAEV